MKFEGSALLCWTVVALSFGLALFVIVSPTGRFVGSPMDHGGRQTAEQASGGLLVARAGDADPRAVLVGDRSEPAPD